MYICISTVHDYHVVGIAVKDSFTDGMSTNMTFERIAASGLGLTIGSIGNTHVKNITFRDCILYKSFKGIYLKFRPEQDGNGGIVEDIVFDHITIEEPIQVRGLRNVTISLE